LENNAPLAVEVKTGISDGKQTEIVSGGLKEGMSVITESTGGTTGGKP
jgi:HlyD family secretion protein